jgi:hypothetical protein
MRPRRAPPIPLEGDQLGGFAASGLADLVEWSASPCRWHALRLGTIVGLWEELACS